MSDIRTMGFRIKEGNDSFYEVRETLRERCDKKSMTSVIKMKLKNDFCDI